jgi:hypothetical protein
VREFHSKLQFRLGSSVIAALSLDEEEHTADNTRTKCQRSSTLRFFSSVYFEQKIRREFSPFQNLRKSVSLFLCGSVFTRRDVGPLVAGGPPSRLSFVVVEEEQHVAEERSRFVVLNGALDQTEKKR